MRNGTLGPNLFVRAVTAIALAAAVAMAFTGPSAIAQPGPPDQEALKARGRPVLEIPGVVSIDADERVDRLVVGVENRGLETAVRQRLAALGVPLQSVEVRQTPPIIMMPALTDRVRPIEGGLQFAFVRFPFVYVCTLGFNGANSAGVNGFAVNSHCTSTQGGVESTEHFQPDTSSGNKIGTEIADPTYFTGGGCPASRRCRYSDSAFSRIESSVTQDLGKLARTTGPNNGSLVIDTARPQFTISSEASGNALVGTTLNKVGRTTGWTQGQVTQSCVDVNVSGSDITQLCQDIVAAGVGGGDSGSPVFLINDLSSGDVTLYGILWGGFSDGSAFVHSPVRNVQMASELGPLTTHAGEGGSATHTPTSTPTNTPTPSEPTQTPTRTSTPTATPTPGSGNANNMYVWDIVFETRTRGPGGSMHDERVAVVVRRDSDADGTAEPTDAPVSGATVMVTVVGSSGTTTLSGTTDSNGTFRTGWMMNLANGTYTAEATNLTHAAYVWNKELDPTTNDADADGDNLPDQSHTIPH